MGVVTESAVKMGAIHHVAFRCRDAGQTRWFYEDVLGLPVAAGLVFEEMPGTRVPNPYMHLFFELGDGNYLAFFDSPGDADPDWFARKGGFDMHVAIQVESDAEMSAMQARIRSFGIECVGPIDHHFVHSVYMYDPNGIQVEITVRTSEHDPVMQREKTGLSDTLKRWTERTQPQKVAKFGAQALELRVPYTRG
jgi:catechol 2,3-dioxygenase-like lactoylglutathione lyase family enzyme